MADLRYYGRRAIALTGIALLAGAATLHLFEPAIPDVSSALAASKPAPLAPAAMLAQLRVAPEDGTGYDRSLFVHWVDADGDGCDTRREVLLAEARTAPTVGTNCFITGGMWVSVYDRVSATGYPRDFDVDHLVPLAEAFASGASAWTPDQRQAYANDLTHPEALIAVTAHSNREKSDADPAEWMPPNPRARCGYVSDWIRVKYAWNLSVDTAEKKALQGLLAGCSRKATLVR